MYVDQKIYIPIPIPIPIPTVSYDLRHGETVVHTVHGLQGPIMIRVTPR